jgi:hypothetical protein
VISPYKGHVLPPSGQAVVHPLSPTGSPTLAWSSPYSSLVWPRFCLDRLVPISQTDSLHMAYPDDGGSKYLWNVGKLLPDYMALQPKRQPSSLFPQSLYFCASFGETTCVEGNARPKHRVCRCKTQHYKQLHKVERNFWSTTDTWVLNTCQWKIYTKQHKGSVGS